jgi:hypothetical protein
VLVIAIALAVVSTLTSPVCSQTRSVLAMEDGEPVAIGTIRKVQSTAMGDERTLLVSLPDDYQTGTASYPVLYLLYGDQVKGYFAETVHHVRRLSNMGSIPRMIIVGVANVDRYRDLRPVASRGETSRIGSFIEFVARELFPFVEREYRTKDFRILVGPQAGAVFGLHVLTAGANLFNAYILNNPFESPDCADQLMRQSEEFLANDLPAYRFLQITCVTKTPVLDLRQAVELARKFEEIASRLDPSNLELTMIYIDDNEDFIPSPNQKIGLRQLFADYAFPADKQVSRLSDFTSYYDTLSSRLGFDVGYPEQPLVLLAVDLARSGSSAEAVEILEFILESNPQSLNACWQMANLQRSLGNREEAIGLFERCLELMPNMAPARKQLEELKGQE